MCVVFLWLGKQYDRGTGIDGDLCRNAQGTGAVDVLH